MAAATPSSPAEAHRGTQAALVARMASVLDEAWSLLDLNDLANSFPQFVAAVTAILDRYGSASTAAANIFYRGSRTKSGASGPMPRVASTRPTEVDIDQVVVRAVSLALTDGPDIAQRSLDSEAEQLVLNQSRRQIMSTAQLDREAKGWARVVEPGACSFCLMLALKGPWYKTHKSGNFRAHKKQPNGSGGDCRCHAEPVFGEWEPQAAVRDAQALWDETNGKGKHSGHDARVAFRQAVEGRKVTGAKKGAAPNGKDRKGRAYEAVTRKKTREQQEHQLQVLTALPPAKTPEAAKWQADRIAEIRKWLSENK